MCGIVAIYNNQIKFDKDMRSKCLKMSKKVRHRGPDWSGIYSSDNAILAHERPVSYTHLTLPTILLV